MPNDVELGKSDLSEAAKRALKEADDRKKLAMHARAEQGSEAGGPSGLEPTRYGDWERKGRAVDF